jgi:hypothetical protein
MCKCGYGAKILVNVTLSRQFCWTVPSSPPIITRNHIISRPGWENKLLLSPPVTLGHLCTEFVIARLNTGLNWQYSCVCGEILVGCPLLDYPGAPQKRLFVGLFTPANLRRWPGQY